MISIHKRSLSWLKEDWNRLACHNPSLNPCQNWDMTKIICRYYLPYFLSGHGEVNQFYSFEENGKVIAIAPLSHRLFSKNYYSIGKSLSIPMRDFIYDENISEEKLEECVLLLLRRLHNIQLLDIPEKSKLHVVLLKLGFIPYKEFPYVTIPMNRYESWYNRLGKHMQQNIRTAYNKLEKNNMCVDFQVVKAFREGRQLMDIYLARRDEHKDLDDSFHKFWLRHFHFYTIASNRLDNALMGVLKLNGEIVSFWSGFISSTKEFITIPRLAIDSKWDKYSPGIILICETAKVLFPQFGIKNFDLSRGEHSYKLRMGGEKYYSHSFDCHD